MRDNEIYFDVLKKLRALYKETSYLSKVEIVNTDGMYSLCYRLRVKGMQEVVFMDLETLSKFVDEIYQKHEWTIENLLSRGGI